MYQQISSLVVVGAIVALSTAGCADFVGIDLAEDTPPPPPDDPHQQVATQFGFTVEPTSTRPGDSITPAVEVALRDAMGNPIVGFSDAVTVTLGTNQHEGVLSGTTTVNATNGIARFGDLSIDREGQGYTLVATSGGWSAVSMPFDVFVPEPLTLLYPIDGDAITQNDSTIGCPAHADRGYGFQIHFQWTQAGDAGSIQGYHLYVKRRFSQYPIVDAWLVSNEFTKQGCNSFVIDRNLEGWDWYVEAFDHAGNLWAASEVATFEFAPCRLADGSACRAPG